MAGAGRKTVPVKENVMGREGNISSLKNDTKKLVQRIVSPMARDYNVTPAIQQ
jgi:hypothetical protein